MKRQFIAGAVCPRCGQLDKLVMISGGENTVRECVRCDFSEQMVVSEADSEVPTRVTRAQARRSETPATPVRLMESPSAADTSSKDSSAAD